ncbi:Helix-turn-helix domain-containing protein [Nannocystis exedens]|uniref:Helix-turn-helix domain-containing protein n=1 Tax=Nannocystis exedens TaxID=54 RepID=A0A1I2BF40_9BACT|nr:helix-turn-helix domain-containing protein [Nannocystis exedens]PCC68021.1 transcriptional regulator [Nannocystis exedens]SFE54498.1 Helix-turn-helix domain-containing protein [Nannocystis exedens]
MTRRATKKPRPRPIGARERADALLHPLRLRIVEAVAAAARPMTAAGLLAALPDVAPATLYRHLNVLVSAGVLRVVGEQPKRGGLERSFTLHEPAAHLDDAAARRLSPGDHTRGFAAFTAHLLDAWGRYIKRAAARGAVDLAADGAGYRSTLLHLDDAEFRELVTALQAALRPFVERGPAPGTRPRLLSTIVFPFDP